MSVTALHPQYEEFQEDWTRCRDAFGGRRLVKAKGTAYLPWLEDQLSAEYTDYLRRAQWFDATERTTVGLAGTILRNDTRIVVPTVMEPDLDDVTLTGQSVQAFSLRILMGQVLKGRIGVEVAMPRDDSPQSHPYWNLWPAEAITNWAEMRIAGQLELVMVVLKEPVNKRVDAFEWDKAAFQYRVLRLVPLPDFKDWVYIQEIWVEDKTATREEDKWVMIEQILPQRRGVALNHIPFTIYGASSIEADVERPPLMGLVDLNYGWYLNSADYENALAAIKPLYFFSGLEEGTEITLGSRRAVNAPDADADGKILQGADPEGLRKAMDEKIKAMAAAGGAMLEVEGGAAETLGAVRIRHGGRQASLRTIATTYGTGLTRTLEYHAMWLGADEDQVEVSPNMDFIDATLTPDQIRAYMELLQENRISYLTFYHLLQGGEITRPGVDAEEELESIAEQTELEVQIANERIGQLEAERIAAGGGFGDDDNEDDEE